MNKIAKRSTTLRQKIQEICFSYAFPIGDEVGFIDEILEVFHKEVKKAKTKEKTYNLNYKNESHDYYNNFLKNFLKRNIPNSLVTDKGIKHNKPIAAKKLLIATNVGPNEAKAKHCSKCSYQTEEGLVITDCDYCGCHYWQKKGVR